MAYKYRAAPSEEQRHFLAQTFGCARYVWNWSLEHRTNAYHNEGESLNFAAMCRRLTQLKKDEEHEWLSDASSVVLQQSLRNQEQAFINFFEGRTSYPSFKRKHGTQSARHTKAAFSYDAETRTLKLAKMPGTLKVNWSRDLRGEPTAVTVTLDPAGRYHVSIEFEAPVEDLPKTGSAVGIDVGINSYVTLSTGEKVGNPRFLEKAYRQLRRAQQKLSRKEKGSQNWKRQKRRVAKIHAKIADKRADFLHKLTRRLVREHDTICVETLSAGTMQKNHCLAKAISDAAWSEFVRQLEYKCEWYGKTLIKIDRWFPSSKRCHHCGHVHEDMSLSVRAFECAGCGRHLDRDVNAGLNIKAVGRAASASGGLRKTERGFVLDSSAR